MPLVCSDLAENVMWLYDAVNAITGLPTMMRVIETAKMYAWKYLFFQLWKYLDNEVEMTPMPPEYRDFKADILCKDCHEVGITHPVIYQYILCKSVGCDQV